MLEYEEDYWDALRVVEEMSNVPIGVWDEELNKD